MTPSKKTVDSVKHNAAISKIRVFNSEYHSEDPVSFYQSMEEKIDSMLKKGGYAKRLDNLAYGKPKLSWKKINTDDRFSFNNQYSIVDERDVPVAYIQEYDDYYVFLVANTAPVTEFIQTLNEVRSTFFSSVSNNDYVLNLDFDKDKVFVGTEKIGIQFFDGPCRADYAFETRIFRRQSYDISWFRMRNLCTGWIVSLVHLRRLYTTIQRSNTGWFDSRVLSRFMSFL